MHVAAYTSEKDNAPRTVDAPWESLVSLLTRHVETSCHPCQGHTCRAKFGRAWSPVEIHGTRANGNVRSVSALVLDFDGITTDQARSVAVALAPFAYVAHTSHSHAALQVQGRHAFRAVVRLSRPVPAAEWRAFRAAAVAQLGVPTDPSCKDLSRIYFLPSGPAGGAHWSASKDGPPLDVDRVLAVGGSHDGGVYQGRGVGRHERGQGDVQGPGRPEAVYVPRPPERYPAVPGGGAPGGPGAPGGEPVANLDGIRRRLRQSGHPLAAAILSGAPLAGPGGRDAALNAAAGLLAFSAPLGTSEHALFEILRPSLNAMDLEPEGAEHWIAEVTNPRDGMLPRALQRRAAEAAKDAAAHAAMLREVFGAAVMDGLSPQGPGATGSWSGPLEVQDPAVALLSPSVPSPPGADGDPAMHLPGCPGPPCICGPGDPDGDGPDGGGIDALLAAPVAPVAAPPWSAALVWNKDRDGNPTSLKNVASNVYAVLTHDRAWQGALRLNKLTSVVEIWSGPVLAPGAPVPVQLADEWVTIIRNWFAQRPEEKLRVDVSTGVMYEQINAVAKAHAYDPVEDYLNGCGEWDGVPRLDTWLETYLGAQTIGEAGEDITEYVRAVAAKWLIAACARTYEPGCQMQNVLILEGEQGLGPTGLRGKSSALAALASREFFTGTAIDIRSPNAPMMTTRTWIVELAELDGFARAEDTARKEFFARDVEEFRPPYGRVVVKRPRRCVFAGTGNRDDYLSDPTGNRRYWPVRVTRADVAGIERDRDQLWAEARERYRAGVAAETPCLWWLTPEEEMIARGVTDERMAPDEWSDAVLGWWTGAGGRKRDVRVLEVAKVALGITVDKLEPRTAQRIGKALRRAGFVKRRKHDGGRLVWYYAPGEALAGPAVVVPLRPVQSVDTDPLAVRVDTDPLAGLL